MQWAKLTRGSKVKYVLNLTLNLSLNWSKIWNKFEEI
jgi:hypothetical protein